MAPIIATTIATDEVQPTGRNENLPTVNSELGDMDDPRTIYGLGLRWMCGRQ
jgi:hypothetical protein